MPALIISLSEFLKLKPKLAHMTLCERCNFNQISAGVIVVGEFLRTGGCQCNGIRYTLKGEPYKSGICHCTDCRQVTGSAFLAYADWRPAAQFEYTGLVRTFRGRSFCPICGSRVFSRNERQVEIYLGTLDDAPNGIKPIDEGWIIRREPWQHPIEGAGSTIKTFLPIANSLLWVPASIC
jgi:hypothetical protein